MVFFTCSHCGESIKKPSVAKHYQTKCRKNEPFLTCVDCLKDFKGTEYEGHTKCVTEDERYSAKGFVPKPSQNKGERKQQAWQECIQTVLKKSTLKPDERNLISALSKHDNVPRKKSKFINFLSNAYRQYANKKDLIDRVWTEMESVFKETTNSNEECNQQEEKAQIEETQDVSSNDLTPALEEKSLKKEKKKKKKKEKRQADEITETSDLGNTDEKVKKKKQKLNEENTPEAKVDEILYETQGKQGKKNKKRKAEENSQAEQNDSVAEEVEQVNKKKKKKHDKPTENGISETPETETKSKKKNKKSKLEIGESTGGVETLTDSVEDSAVKKKRKKSENKENCEEKTTGEAEEGSEPPKKKKAKGEDAGGENNKQETFDWKATILSVLNEDCKKKKIQLQKLQKKVIKLHCQILNCETSEKKEKKFMKKLKEMPQVEIDNDFVVLKS